MNWTHIFSLCCGIICIIFALVDLFLIYINIKRHIKFNKKLYFNYLVILYKVDLLLLSQCESVEDYNYSQASMHKSSYSFFNGGCYPLTEEQFNFLKEEMNK